MGQTESMTEHVFIVRSELKVKEGRLDDLIEVNEQIRGQCATLSLR